MPLTLEPQTAQTLQRGQQNAPEWARILAQVLPMLAPTGATGAALSMAPGQAQPQSDWAKVLPLLPILVGAVGMMRGGKGGIPNPEGENILQQPSSMEQFKQETLSRGGTGKGISSDAVSKIQDDMMSTNFSTRNNAARFQLIMEAMKNRALNPLHDEIINELHQQGPENNYRQIAKYQPSDLMEYIDKYFVPRISKGETPQDVVKQFYEKGY